MLKNKTHRYMENENLSDQKSAINILKAEGLKKLLVIEQSLLKANDSDKKTYMDYIIKMKNLFK